MKLTLKTLPKMMIRCQGRRGLNIEKRKEDRWFDHSNQENQPKVAQNGVEAPGRYIISERERFDEDTHDRRDNNTTTTITLLKMATFQHTLGNSFIVKITKK